MNLSARDRVALSKASLLERLPETLREAVLDDAVVRHYPKGAVLFEYGDRVTRFFAVLSGWTKLYRLQADGTEVILEVMGPGQTFAELAMYSDCGYPATAEMATGGRLASFSSDTFLDLVHECPDLADAMLSDISAHLQRFIDRVESSHCRTTPQRLAEFLLRHCKAETSEETPVSVQLPFPKQLIANLLGMQPETFSRAAAALQARGVAMKGRKVRIRNLEALRRFACNEE